MPLQADYEGTFTAEDPVQQAYARPGDQLDIKFDTSNPLTAIFVFTPSPNDAVGAAYKTFWESATKSYDPMRGIIVGVSGVDADLRQFSIALDRRTGVHRIHVYVSARAQFPPAPDDGSWTGTGGN